MTDKITLSLEPELSPAEFADVLHRSTLAARRPVDDIARLEGMLHQADVIVTARRFRMTMHGSTSL